MPASSQNKRWLRSRPRWEISPPSSCGLASPDFCPPAGPAEFFGSKNAPAARQTRQMGSRPATRITPPCGVSAPKNHIALCTPRAKLSHSSPLISISFRFYFSSDKSASNPFRRTSARVRLCFLQYASKASLLFSSNLTFRSTIFGFSTFGLPVLGLSFITSLFEYRLYNIVRVPKSQRLNIFAIKPCRARLLSTA